MRLWPLLWALSLVLDIFPAAAQEFSFENARRDYYVARQGSLFSIAAGDFNGDGKPDLVAALDPASKLYLLRGTSGGILALARPIPVASGRIALADRNGDSKLDIVTPTTARTPSP